MLKQSHTSLILNGKRGRKKNQIEEVIPQRLIDQGDIARQYKRNDLAPGPVVIYTEEMIREYQQGLELDSPK